MGCLPGIVFALGLGKLDLDSALNQPFEAKIELVLITAEELSSLRLGLADAEAFRRADVDRPFVLSQLRFELVENEDGQDYIRVYSQEPIREPYLNFLVEASWSKGRLYREYTVLLDPPLYDPNVRRSQAQPISRTPEPSFTRPEPEPQVAEEPSITPSYTSDYTTDEYGPVASGDTLWAVAIKTRPDSSVSIQKMMLALLRANPEAFINGNINGLMRGQVLRLPDVDEIDSLNQGQALDEVRAQNSLWQDMRGSIAAGTSERPVSADSEPTDDETDVEEDDAELRIVAPSDSGAGTGGLDVTTSSEQLNEEISLVDEQLEAISQENIELKDQLSEAESIVSDLDRLIELKDDELAVLQQQVVEEEIEETEVDDEIIEDDFVEDDEEVIEEEIEDTTQTTTTVPVEPPLGIVGQIQKVIMDNIMIVGGALLVIIVVIGLLVFMRRRGASSGAATTEGATAFPDFTDEEGNIETQIGSHEESTEAGIDSEAATVIPAVAEEEAAEDAHTEFIAPPVDVPAAETETAVDEPEDDALAEVNVFLAYEHFEQAEEFVRDAIAGDPDKLDYHDKLLEVFYASGNKASYEEEAKVLHDMVGGQGPHWEMATAMWQEMSPSRALFEEPAEGETEEAVAETGGGVLDLTADEGEKPETASPPDASLDFDIGGDTDGETLSTASDDILDISSAGADEDVLDETSTIEADQEGEDLLDVTAAVGMDIEVPEVDEAASAADEILDITSGEDEELLDVTSSGDAEVVLDITSGEEAKEASEDLLDVSSVSGEDLLDVTAHANLEEEEIEEDLLDVTSATSAGVDSSGLLEVEEEEAEVSDDNSLDFDVGVSEDTPSEEVQEEENLVDFDASPASEGDEEILDLSFDEPAATEEAEDAVLDLSMELDSEDASNEADGSSEEGLDIDLSVDDIGPAESTDDEISIDVGDSEPDVAGFELDLTIGDDAADEEAGDPTVEIPEIDMEVQEEDSSGEEEFSLDLDTRTEDSDTSEADMDSTVEMPKLEVIEDDEEDDDDDEEEHTVFVPRGTDGDEQTEEDEIATKLDLAKAYVELGDKDSARGILEEVIAEGSDEQRKQAQELLDQVS